jgi:hypothetical protein
MIVRLEAEVNVANAAPTIVRQQWQMVLAYVVMQRRQQRAHIRVQLTKDVRSLMLDAYLMIWCMDLIVQPVAIVCVMVSMPTIVQHISDFQPSDEYVAWFVERRAKQRPQQPLSILAQLVHPQITAACSMTSQ